jgi:hypothetical protein
MQSQTMQCVSKGMTKPNSNCNRVHIRKFSIMKRCSLSEWGNGVKVVHIVHAVYSTHSERCLAKVGYLEMHSAKRRRAETFPALCNAQCTHLTVSARRKRWIYFSSPSRSTQEKRQHAHVEGLWKLNTTKCMLQTSKINWHFINLHSALNHLNFLVLTM